MQVSARNQLKATVTEVKKGAVNNEIDLTLSKGTPLTAIITTASSERSVPSSSGPNSSRMMLSR